MDLKSAAGSFTKPKTINPKVRYTYFIYRNHGIIKETVNINCYYYYFTIIWKIILSRTRVYLMLFYRVSQICVFTVKLYTDHSNSTTCIMKNCRFNKLLYSTFRSRCRLIILMLLWSKKNSCSRSYILWYGKWNYYKLYIKTFQVIKETIPFI